MVTRSRKVEKAIKENDKEFFAIGKIYDGCPTSEYTNEGSDSFCPFIDNKKLGKAIIAGHGEGDVHRDYPAKLAWGIDPYKMNQLNRTYHFIQFKNWTSGQFCKYQKDPEKDYTKCECRFKECSVYKSHVKEA